MDPELPLPQNEELHHLYLLRQNFQKQIQAMEALKAEIFQVLAYIARNSGGFSISSLHI